MSVVHNPCRIVKFHVGKNIDATATVDLDGR